MTTPSAIVPAKPAATVIVLRDSARGPEVFMVRRTFTIAFMAGAHVFPGGRVDERDRDADTPWCDLPESRAGQPPVEFAIASARELFEEAGVLLARDGAGRFVRNESRVDFDAMRQAVHEGSMTMKQVVDQLDARLALDALIPLAHWVTPRLEARRFDTWFFVAAVPDGQVPAHDGSESIDSAWLTPLDALAQCEAGAINLPPPTWATLRELQPFKTVADVLEWASARTVHERSPIATETARGREIILPGDADHPSTERVTFETRFLMRDGRWLPDVNYR